MTIRIKLIHPRASQETLGLIPGFLDDSDPRPAREQLDANYQHGGGWRPQPGFVRKKGSFDLRYPGDPPFQPVAMILFRDEIVVLYQFAYVAIFQPGGEFEICRMD